MIVATTGSRSPPMRLACSRAWAPTAAYRSATNDPPYSRLAASSRGAMSTPATSTPTARSRATAARNASAQPSARPGGWGGNGTAMRTGPASAPASALRSRQPPRGRPPSRVASGSAPSGPAITPTARRASGRDRANPGTQASDRQAGTTPVHGMTPRVGLTPTTPFSAAGTRPEPAVSVPRAKSTRPSATATADPALEPPEILAGSHALRTAPYGLRVPTRPVANWSRLVLPSTTAPAARSRTTAVASRAGRYSYEGAPAVVGSPATSMLSLTAATSPASGSCSPAATTASIAAASARASAAGRSVIQISGRPAASMAAYAAVTRATALIGRQRS